MATGALFRSVSSRLLLVLVAALLAPLAGAQPWHTCGGDRDNFTENSIYQANIKVLSTTLPKNASTSSKLFANTSVGDNPNIVYALTLCRGDINASACESCVANAFQDAQQMCALNKDAAVYEDTCYLRFFNTNFVASNSNGDHPIYLSNLQGVISSPVPAFDSAVGALLNATGDYAAANSTRRYATGQGGFDSTYPNIYGLTQCIPDLSAADCRSCLGDIIRTIPQYFSGKIGARIIGIRCNFRYEVYPFISGSPSLRLPAPSSLVPAAAPTPVNATPTTIPHGEMSG